MVAVAHTPAERLRLQAADEFANLIGELGRAREGSDGAVHRARKSIQRLRAKLRLLRGLQPEWARRADLALRRLRRRLGPLRDAGVRVELVREILPRAETAESRESLECALLVLRQQLARAWQQTPSGFWDRVDVDCQRAVDKLPQWPVDGLDATAIERVLERARQRLRRAIRSTVGHTQPGRRHELRRRLRRYAALRRAAAEVLRRRDPLAQRLIDTARSLGAEGDLWLTCTALRRADPSVAGKVLRAALERQRRALCLSHDGVLMAFYRGTLRRTHRKQGPVE